MPEVFYPCCEVGDKVPYSEEGPLKSNCWICGDPMFIRVMNMDVDAEYSMYYRFVYHGRVQGAESTVTPPWRL